MCISGKSIGYYIILEIGGVVKGSYSPPIGLRILAFEIKK